MKWSSIKEQRKLTSEELDKIFSSDVNLPQIEKEWKQFLNQCISNKGSWQKESDFLLIDKIADYFKKNNNFPHIEILLEKGRNDLISYIFEKKNLNVNLLPKHQHSIINNSFDEWSKIYDMVIYTDDKKDLKKLTDFALLTGNFSKLYHIIKKENYYNKNVQNKINSYLEDPKEYRSCYGLTFSETEDMKQMTKINVILLKLLLKKEILEKEFSVAAPKKIL